MKSVRPKPLGVVAPSPGAAPLTAEESFVYSRMDGRLTVTDLASLTGIAEQKVESIVHALASRGAVAVEEAAESSRRFGESADASALGVEAIEGTASLADFAAALGMDPSAFAPAPAPSAAQPVAAQPVAAQPVAAEEPAPQPTLEAPAEEPVEAEPAARRSSHPSAAEYEDELIEVRDDEAAPAPAAPEASATDGEAEPDAKTLDQQEADRAVAERNYRQLYEVRFRAMTPDERIAQAHKQTGPDLYALCYDADPRVVAAILENHTVGLDHVRMLALHHRTATGLEMVSRRSDWIRDMLVERRLLRNPMAGETILSRIMLPKRVLQTYKICIDREIPEITRAKSRGYLRSKWQQAPPEDRSELIIRTEARCLILMTGCTFDARTTQMLCARPYNSVLFIQNLAKFPATSPGILAHLMKQPFVRKNPVLKKLLLSHPNLPGDVKRQI